MPNPELRQQTVRIRALSPGNAAYLTFTMPKHVNEIACFNAGETVVISSTGPGMARITRLQDVSAEDQQMHGKPKGKFDVATVDLLRLAWSRGVSSSQIAKATGISSQAARNYYRDFKDGLK